MLTTAHWAELLVGLLTFVLIIRGVSTGTVLTIFLIGNVLLFITMSLNGLATHGDITGFRGIVVFTTMLALVAREALPTKYLAVFYGVTFALYAFVVGVFFLQPDSKVRMNLIYTVNMLLIPLLVAGILWLWRNRP